MAKIGLSALYLLQGSDLWVTIALMSLQIYLTQVWELSISHAAAILNIWAGICMILPCFFLFLVDQFFGHFPMLTVSSISYSSGVALIAMSTPPVLGNLTGTCTEYRSQCVGHTQKVVFYIGLALLAVGKSGHHVSLAPFIDHQYTMEDSLLSVRLKVIFSLLSTFALVAAIAIPSISIPKSIQYGLAAACSTIGTLLFLCFSNVYEKNRHDGSPMVNVCRVFVACATKRLRPFSLDDTQLYKQDETECLSVDLSFLDRAAMYAPEDDVNDKWKVCSVAEVETAKIVIRMIPMSMCITLIGCGILLSMENTYFVEQENNMNRRIGAWNTPVQAPLIVTRLLRSYISFSVSGFMKRRILARNDEAPNSHGEVPNNNGEAPYNIMPNVKSMGTMMAIIFSVLCCITAAKIESRRLNVIRRYGLVEDPGADIPMAYYWLLFQFFLIANVEAYLEHSISAFYASSAPVGMIENLNCFREAALGVGYIVSVLSVHVVGQISERGGRPNWFQPTLNKSRLDKYYWVLTALCSPNHLVRMVLCSLKLMGCLFIIIISYSYWD